MAESQVEQRIFVVCWRDKQTQHRFFTEPAWTEARDRFEQVFEVLHPDGDIERFRALYGTVEGSGIVPEPSQPIGLFLCRASGGHDLFVVARGCGKCVPVLGSRLILESRLDGLPSGLGIERYFPQDLAAFEADQRTPPSDMKRTREATECLDALLAGSDVGDSSQQITQDELIWVGHAARETNPSLAHRVAELAVKRSRRSGALNLEGAVLRDLGLYRRSAESYRESISLRSSAKSNPYGFVGLAATLRRLHEYDEAHDFIKKVNRHYPEDKYVAKTFNAILSDMRPDRIDRRGEDWERFGAAA